MEGYAEGYGYEIEPEEKITIDPNLPTTLFVYGSFKKGHKHHTSLGKDRVWLGDVVTEPHYLLYDTGPYPGMIEVKDGQGRAIEGELYLVMPNDMLRLEKLVPAKFKKIEVRLRGIEGRAITHVWDFGVSEFLDCGTSWPRT